MTAGVWVVAIAAIAFGLYWFRDALTQFALAFVLWLVIDGLARFLCERAKLPLPLGLPIALVLVLGASAVVVAVIAQNIGAFASHGDAYQARLDALIADVWRLLGLAGPAPTVSGALADASPTQFLSGVGRAIQSVIGDVVFILIYLGFLFAAASQFPKKLDAIFPSAESRDLARDVFTSIRTAMERYLWVQTIASVLITALTYATLLAIGLPNALFWSFLIFFLNFIPTIGSLIAFALPTVFALVEFEELWRVGLVAAGVGVWQFAIGNFIQPRLTGDSLNLSTIVVLLALAIWGALWGIAGAFLAAPLTVMAMIVLAQFKSTRWLAILLSADGNPKAFGAADRRGVGPAQPSLTSN
jgi:predicted PurR-regulated permease PerM